MKSENESELIQNSYAYWEYYLQMGRLRNRYTRNDCTEQAERFAAISQKAFFFSLMIAMLITCSFFGCVFYFFDVHEKYISLGGGMFIAMLYFLIIYSHYLLFPRLGRIAFNQGIIDKEQLFIITNCRVPKNFILPEFRETDVSNQKSSE